MMLRFPAIGRSQLLTGALVLLLLGVQGAGIALSQTSDDIDTLLKNLDPQAQERAADALRFNQDALTDLFQSDVQTSIAESGALASLGESIDTQRVQDLLAGELSDVDFLTASGSQILGRFSQLQERMEIQTEISERVSISSFESSIVDKQTKLIEDKMQELSDQKDTISNQWFKDLGAADKASSFINNLPPM